MRSKKKCMFPSGESLWHEILGKGIVLACHCKYFIGISNRVDASEGLPLITKLDFGESLWNAPQKGAANLILSFTCQFTFVMVVEGEVDKSD